MIRKLFPVKDFSQEESPIPMVQEYKISVRLRINQGKQESLTFTTSPLGVITNTNPLLGKGQEREWTEGPS